MYYNKTERATVRRHRERGSYERETIDAILDEGFVGHLAYAADGQPFAIPMLYARGEQELYLHGSPLSRLIRGVASGIPVCFTVTLIDGIVLARSAFHHSINYRSAVILGTGRTVEDREEKHEALRLVVEHVARGRSEEVRGPSDGELRATEVLAVTISEASAKVRTGPPGDATKDYALPVWAGELPLSIEVGEPIPDDRCEVDVPPSVEHWSRVYA